jgi:hypothetical protein
VDFTIRGNPAAIRSRAATTRGKGQLFFDTGDALAKISVDGWTGRAADHFRDRHDLEPDRWTEAGNGFLRAGSALEGYAAAVEDAQRRAAWAEGEYARGDDVTSSARSSYDADVARAREEQSNAIALGGTGSVGTLTILPFDDPGQAIRQGALDELASARADLDAAAHTCADEVRRGCADAPEEPGWLESGLRFVGGVLEGAGEALWDLATLTPFSPINMLQDLTALATGDLTPEELMAKYRLSLETAQGMLDALAEDAVGFGKELGKGLLDWDTWADDPARALGHLVPDAVVAVLTAGSGTAATRGVGSIDDVADGLTAINRLDDAAALGRMDELADLGRLDDLGDLSRLEDLGDLSRTYSMMDDVPHTTSFAPEQLGTTPVDGVLLRHGVTRDDFIDLVTTPTDALTDSQRATLNAVRDDLPGPDADTVMQKVVSQPHFDADGNLVAGGVDDYVLGNRTDFDPTQVRGSVTVADQSSQLATPAQIHDGLRLDYDGTSFSPDDPSVHVIRFQTDNPGSFEVPRNADMGAGGSTRYDSWGDPFTGNGFTKAGDDVVPELIANQGVPMRDGAEMWEVLDDGTQRLVAVLRDQQWIPQGN